MSTELVPLSPQPSSQPAVPALAASTFDLMAAIWADLAERTRRAYEKDYADFARFLAVADGPAALEVLLSLPAGDANALALAYRARMQERGLKPATIARRIGALKTAVKRARTVGRVAWTLETPTPRVERYKDVRGPGLMGFARMLAVVENQTDAKSLRDRAMLRLLWGLALRRGELVALDLADVDLDGDRIAVLGKGHTDREWLTLPPGAKGALLGWLRVRGLADGALFVNLHTGKPGGRLTADGLHEIVRALAMKAGLKPTRPHAIRHASISECAHRSNGNMVVTGRFGRHKNIQTTSRYIDEFEDVFGTMARLVDGALED